MMNSYEAAVAMSGALRDVVPPLRVARKPICPGSFKSAFAEREKNPSRSKFTMAPTPGMTVPMPNRRRNIPFAERLVALRTGKLEIAHAC
jgi:hypothetical protein